MTTERPAADSPPAEHNTPSDHDSVKSKTTRDVKGPQDVVSEADSALASRENQRMEGVLGDAILRFLRIRKGPKFDTRDLDAVSS